MTTRSRLFSLVSGYFSFGNLAADVAYLALRVHAGYTISRAGFDKFPVSNWFAGQVSDLGFPLPAFFANLAAGSEALGGILIALGLFTRPAALLAGATMAVAAFQFHGVLPIAGMHIAQLFVWIFVLIMCAGGGRFSLDAVLFPVNQETERGRLALSPVPAAALVIVFGLVAYDLFRDGTAIEAPPAAATVESMQLAGTFNNWQLSATPMDSSDGKWQVDVDIADPGPIEFKFTANGSWDLQCGADSAAEQVGGFPLSGTGVLNTQGEPANIVAYIPRPGSYQFVVDSESLEYRLDVAPAATSP